MTRGKSRSIFWVYGDICHRQQIKAHFNAKAQNILWVNRSSPLLIVCGAPQNFVPDIPCWVLAVEFLALEKKKKKGFSKLCSQILNYPRPRKSIILKLSGVPIQGQFNSSAIFRLHSQMQGKYKSENLTVYLREKVNGFLSTSYSQTYGMYPNKFFSWR